MRRAAILFPLTLVAPALAQTPSFTLVGYPDPEVGQGTSQVFALSADGQSASGHSLAQNGFLWTRSGGRNDFGLSLDPGTFGFGISGDGRTVVGGGNGFQNPTVYRAYSWTAANGYRDLGLVGGLPQAEARDASFDGSVIVGTGQDQSGGSVQAFRWTEAGGMQGLGAGTRAMAVSGDGSVVVGSFSTTPLAFRWTQAGGLQFLTPLGGSGSSAAFCINSSGNMIAGFSGPTGRGTLWIDGVPTALTSSAPGQFNPYSISDDGSVIAGMIDTTSSGRFPGVWTAATGVVRLSDYLTANGVVIPDGVVLDECRAVSADGLTFGGWTEFPTVGIQGFVATIPPPCPADLDNDGLFSTGQTRDRAVTIDDLLYFLTAFELGHPSADLDDGSNTGTRDDAVEVSDLLFFLARFEAGC